MPLARLDCRVLGLETEIWSIARGDRVNWEEFERTDAESAGLGEERLETTGLVILGALRE